MTKLTMFVAVLALAAGCKGRDAGGRHAAPADNEDVFATEKSADRPEEGKADSAAAAPPLGRAQAIESASSAGVLGQIGSYDSGGGYGVGGGRGGKNAAAPSAKSEPKKASKDRAKGGDSDDETGAGEEAAVRAWFPETFLFEPLIVTDDQGHATVPVRVPDRLTNWRILALAHSREGAQGGATASFLGTLPTYVDLVVPEQIYVGDRIKLPIQVVNTTDKPSASTLAVTAKNAEVAGGSGAIAVPAQGGAVTYTNLTANRAGAVEVSASLAGTDAVRRVIEVRPLGRPDVVSRTGTLAEPRTFTLRGPAGSDPATDRVRLLVYPGALALVRSELGASTSRGSLADTAYTLLLAGRASAMLSSLGDKADPEALRNLSILAGQRAIRAARTLDVWSATLLAEPALAHPQNPILARLGERAAAYLAQNQRPDGTFSGGTGWTLQRVLVATAHATRAVQAGHLTTQERQRAQGVAMKASGAFARTATQVTDGYTAAAILASGAVTGPLAETLRERVRAAIKVADDGTKYLEVGDVVDAAGNRPSIHEATAFAILALQGDPTAPLADLGSTLLGAYSPASGWGGGEANLVCMRAVVEMFKTPVPEGVKITLTMDGRPVSEGTLDRAALREVLALEAAAPDGFAGDHEWKLVAEPAVPGLGYSLSLHGWVPWKREAQQQGLEMAVTPADVTADVGKPIELSISAIAPSNTPLVITQMLPAGVQVDTDSLDALVSANTIHSFEVAEGKLTLKLHRLAQGATFLAKYRVIPTLAGTLHTAASSIAAREKNATYYVPPSTWTIR